jgi:tetratricopeptide (TPR) repeat protein
VRRLSVVVVVLATSAGFAGCAARARPAVRPGAAENPSATGGSLQEYMAKIRHLSVTARPAPSGTPAAMLESRDAELAEALREAQASPTADSLRRAGELYRQRGVLDAAYRYFNRVIQLNPRDAAAYEGLARVWRDWKLPELAMGDAHRAVYYAPRSAAAQNTLGTIMQALGQDEAAHAAYQLASTLDPKAAYAVNNLCYLSLLGGRIDAAIQKCRAALTVDPSLVAARNNLGLALAASGRMDLARTQFLDADDRATGLYNTGIAYLASGDDEGALSAFDEASRSRPLFHLARERAQQIRARLFKQSHNLPGQVESEFER